jgi:YD repeat-containing protein
MAVVTPGKTGKPTLNLDVKSAYLKPVSTRTDPLSTLAVPRVSSWLYDTAGRVKEKKDALGRRFTFN